jgi:hypothetical protein
LITFGSQDLYSGYWVIDLNDDCSFKSASNEGETIKVKTVKIKKEQIIKEQAKDEISEEEKRKSILFLA